MAIAQRNESLAGRNRSCLAIGLVRVTRAHVGGRGMGGGGVGTMKIKDLI